jgi:hypothetical protein
MRISRFATLSAALIAISTVAIVKAQTDDLFGSPGSEAEANQKDARNVTPGQGADPFGAGSPGQPAPAPAEDEDLFGPSTARSGSTPKRNQPSQPGPAQIKSDLSQNNLCRCEGEANQAAHQRIEAALDSRLGAHGIDFADTPITEVVDMLQQEYQVPIHIDAKALDEIGVGPDEPVTVNLQGISLRSALRLMLKQHQLTYIIDDEVLLITTPEESDSRVKVCVYDVRDLVGSNPASTLKQLSEVVTSCVSPDSWNGGGGSIRSFPPNLLVISQPQAVHVEINSLLKRMREMRSQ